ncbi:MAG: amino acid permease [Thermaerobacter sp.]|nr:amino acid permease [Thermaerobacter sp.]
MGIFTRDHATQSHLSSRYAGKEVRGKDLGTPQLTMMTIGGIIGSGLFLASGQAIRQAGPGLILGYLIGATAMAIEVTALAEMSAADPEKGSFLVYSRRALGPGFTFVGGWVFWFSSVLNLAAEATAAGVFTHLWLPNVPTWITSTTFALLIVGINFLTVKGFGEVESGMSVIKVGAIALFIVLFGLIVFAGWPVSLGHGMASWSVAGGFLPNGLRGVAAAMIVVMFSMSGTGVLGLAAASVRKPERTVGLAVRYSVLMVYLLYIGSILGITSVIAWNKVPATGESPFLAALHRLPWPIAAQIFNVVILLAVLSAMNAGLFATDRVLAGLAKAKDAPKWLEEKGDKPPRAANAATGALLVAVTLLTYFLPKTAFLYLVTATGFQALFVWLLIVLTQIYYRRNLRKEHPERLRLKVAWYPYLSIFEVILLLAIIATAPLAPHQILPLVLGVVITALFTIVYLFIRPHRHQNA